MKKVMMVSVMLMAAVAANAQMKVAPKMELGVERTYTTVNKVAVPTQGDVIMTLEQKYTVGRQTADGFVMDVVTTDVKTEAADNNIAGKLIAATGELMSGLNIQVATDKDGKVVKINNYADVKPELDKRTDKLVESMAAVPELSAIPKDALKNQIKENLTEEKLLATMKESTSILALNGKTVMTGAQDEYTNDDGLKLKRMYFVNGKTITANGTLSMSKEDMKALIIQQVEKAAPEQADMIKQNIDQLIDSGMLKMDVKETATYELGDDGWVKSLKSEATQEAMGQKTVSTTTVTLK